jgi:hypothetical protein
MYLDCLESSQRKKKKEDHVLKKKKTQFSVNEWKKKPWLSKRLSKSTHLFLVAVSFLISNTNSVKNFSITKISKLKLLRYFYEKLPIMCLKCFYSKMSSQTLTDVL